MPDSVKKIGWSAFNGCTGLTSVSIPNSVTNIGDSAFYGCSGLTGITIPDNVTTIGSYSFYRCTGLTDLSIGKNVSSIGDNAFGDCYYLTLIKWNAKNVCDFVGDPDFSGNSEAFFDAGKSGCGITVVFGDEVEFIPSWAFSSYRSYSSGMGSSLDFNTAKIIKVIMGKSLKYVGIRAFYNCSDLEEIVFNDIFKHIGGAAFMHCEALESITLPESLTTIDSGAFRYCSSLKEIKWNAKNIDADSFGTFVFSDCGNSEKGISITFGENVENIPDNLFYSEGSGYVKPQIKSVVIGNNMKAIPENLFWGMSLLTSITIPDTAIVIGNSAFENCGYYNNSENWDNGYLYINNHLISTNKTIASATVREGTITIAGGAFKENTELLKINLPATVEIISDYAFYNCNNLLKITIPENVSFIGEYAFSGCSSITKINIPSSVEKIGYHAFGSCDSLEGVYITDINAWSKIEFLSEDSYGWTDFETNPLYIARNLYVNNELAESIYITENITNLSNNLFANCDSIKSVVLPESLTTIGANAFYDCDNLISINIPASVTSIGYDAFDDCWDLENVYITDLSAWCTITFEGIEQNPLRSGAYLYLNGERLEDLVIPEDITVLGNYTFYNCDSIKSVVLHDNVDKVEGSVFYDCDSLIYVVIPEDILYIKNNAFSGCSNIDYVFFKGSQTLWDDMLIYSGNDSLNNATVVCDATEKTYKYDTNCGSRLSDITTYCLIDAPKPYNEKQVLAGWYDNAALSGDAIEFPYYGDATTLYASWNERIGTSFDDAIYLKENKTNKKIVDAWDYVYYEFVPQFSGQYRFYATGSDSIYINLYNQDKNYIGYTNNGEYLSYDYFEAGTVYYLSIRSDISTEISLTIETDLTIGTSSKVSQDGKNFAVTVKGIPTGKTIILALYDGDKFVGMQSATYIGNEIYFTTTEEYTNAKVMVWDNFTKLKPVCGVEIVK